MYSTLSCLPVLFTFAPSFRLLSHLYADDKLLPADGVVAVLVEVAEEVDQPVTIFLHVVAQLGHGVTHPPVAGLGFLTFRRTSLPLVPSVNDVESSCVLHPKLQFSKCLTHLNALRESQCYLFNRFLAAYTVI